MVIGTNTDWSATYNFLLTFHSNHGPISHRYWDEQRFTSKTANFSHPRVFCTHWRGSPGNWYWHLGSKSRTMMLPGWEKVWQYLQPSGYNIPMWWTHTGRQQRPRLCIASRSNKTQSGDILVPANPGPSGKWPLKCRESVTLDGYNVSIAVTWHIANRIVSYMFLKLSTVHSKVLWMG